MNDFYAQDTIRVPQPPKDREAEESVIGAILLNTDVLYTTCLTLNEKHFFFMDLRAVFRAIKNLTNVGTELTLITVKREVKRLELTGVEIDEIFLVGLQERMHSRLALKTLVELLKTLAMYRKIIKASLSIATIPFGRSFTERKGVLESVSKKFSKMMENSDIDESPLLDTADLAPAYLLKKLEGRDEQVVEGRCRTGIGSLDRIINGFDPGQLITVAGTTGSGKTSFAIQCALVAAMSGKKVGFFSLEMQRGEIYEQMAAKIGNFNNLILQEPEITVPQERQMVVDAAAQMKYLHIFIEDDSSMSLEDILSRARKMKREKDIKFLVVDYIGLIEQATKARNRNYSEEIGGIVRSFKKLAGELKIPIMELAQLNKEGEKKQSGIPAIADLKDSSSIGQHSNKVIFVARKGETEIERLIDGEAPGGERDHTVVQLIENIDPRATVLVVAKNRGGAKGRTTVKFIPETTTFEDY